MWFVVLVMKDTGEFAVAPHSPFTNPDLYKLHAQSLTKNFVHCYRVGSVRLNVWLRDRNDLTLQQLNVIIFVNGNH